MREIGTIKTWLDPKGYGFISPDDGSGDVFVHVNKIAADVRPYEGMRVQFYRIKHDNGRERAVSVESI